MHLVDKQVDAPELIGRRGYLLHGPMPTRTVQVWVDDHGNEVGEPLPDVPPAALTQADYAAAIQTVLDAKAAERGYDSIASAATYVGSTVPQFAAEGLAMRDWRDGAWVFAYAQLALVAAGERAQPTIAEFLDELTLAVPFAWPA